MDNMKKLLILYALLIFACGFGQTAITNANFYHAIETCLSTHPVTGMCSDSEYGSMPDWDVSQVTDMSYAFRDRNDFNADIGAWDVSNVTDMSLMFLQANSFNQPIGDWDVSSVIDMGGIFYTARDFNQPIGDWDVSSVTIMGSMFFQANSFNQPIGAWDVSSVTNMGSMFEYAQSFDQEISDWDVSSVTIMGSMFAQASSFNQPIGAWDVSNVVTISYMFSGTSFNQPIGTWDVSNVTDMSWMFNQASSFNQPVENWDVSNVTDMSWMFNQASSFNQPVENWDVSNVTDMSYMFSGAQDFNQPIGDWDVSSVADMSRMFVGAQDFNQPIGDWVVSNVTNMRYMFAYASSFNQDISSWCVININAEPTDFSDFSPLVESNKPSWGTCPSNLTPITNANFYQAIETCLSTHPVTGMCSDSEYGSMPDWDVSSVRNMSNAFENRNDFNADISAWDVSNVFTMSGMFRQASSFNKPIGAWDVSSVRNMGSMFAQASSFNQPIGAWDVRNVTLMNGMFRQASSFNQPIGAWALSRVTSMNYMFAYASSFNQNISNWCFTIFPSEPVGFSNNSPLTEINKPVWGTCPSSTYEWINYGTQDWTVENAEMVTYRDGTPIPQVTDFTEWANLTTGAWCYYDNDPTKGKLYNWYAVAGIHDNDPDTTNKILAPQGWHVPSDTEWTTLENYFIANGYNYDGTTTENKIAKAMASTTGWNSATEAGAPGNDQSLNNSSGFNAYPVGFLSIYDNLCIFEGDRALFWTSTENINGPQALQVFHTDSNLFSDGFNQKSSGYSVRFVRYTTSLSTSDLSSSIIMYPNPVKNMLTIDGLVVKDVVIYSVLGKAVLNISNQNTIDVSSLSKGVYFIKVSDGINASTNKFIKE